MYNKWMKEFRGLTHVYRCIALWREQRRNTYNEVRFCKQNLLVKINLGLGLG